jgi:Fe-S cluster assembly iron-binding protein IscA
MIQVTDAAASKFKEIVAKEKNPEEMMLRIAFGGIS